VYTSKGRRCKTGFWLLDMNDDRAAVVETEVVFTVFWVAVFLETVFTTVFFPVALFFINGRACFDILADVLFAVDFVAFFIII
jgi:hypothetical protein